MLKKGASIFEIRIVEDFQLGNLLEVTEIIVEKVIPQGGDFLYELKKIDSDIIYKRNSYELSIPFKKPHVLNSVFYALSFSELQDKLEEVWADMKDSLSVIFDILEKEVASFGDFSYLESKQDNLDEVIAHAKELDFNGRGHDVFLDDGTPAPVYYELSFRLGGYALNKSFFTSKINASVVEEIVNQEYIQEMYEEDLDNDYLLALEYNAFKMLRVYDFLLNTFESDDNCDLLVSADSLMFKNLKKPHELSFNAYKYIPYKGTTKEDLEVAYESFLNVVADEFLIVVNKIRLLKEILNSNNIYAHLNQKFL